MKKALSILLALTMALALALPAAASGAAVQSGLLVYGDAGKVKYPEAVEYLTGAGVVSGTSSTTIDPKGSYTREQAAKIIAYMRLGPTAAENLKCTTVPFSDVEATDWSAPYISYCSSETILAGDGTGKFLPNKTVSVSEMLKMALCALGYDAEELGLTGKGWGANTLALAGQAGVLAGLGGAEASMPLDRETGMQVAFNACTNAQVVEYDQTAKAHVGTGTTLGESVLDMDLNIDGDSHNWSVADKPVTDNYKNDPVGGGMPDTADAAAMYGNTLRIVSGGAAYTATVSKDAKLSLNNADGQTVQSGDLSAGAALPVNFTGKLSLSYSSSGEIASVLANMKDFTAKDLGYAVIKQIYTKDGKDYVSVFDGTNTTDYVYTAKSKEMGVVRITQKSDGTVSVSAPENSVSGSPSAILKTDGVNTGMTVNGTTLSFSANTKFIVRVQELNEATQQSTPLLPQTAADVSTQGSYEIAYHVEGGVNVADMVYCGGSASAPIIIIPPVESMSPDDVLAQ